ncbi:squamous cell carcinoma antigen 2 [Brachionus plicatilis]|uniref:Squamous cell carcinoma antigen 2 n=2 Tax=Brachionus plicatilis TaxID=10195 RepID=A0A3M7RWK8_BRAPC|nr:squamous cell carcinoma antigen 2 [Brachionus plicatilis]
MSLSDSLNSFTHKLFNQLNAGKDDNFFISPFSISTALAMCYAGAKCETASQLKDLLSLTNLDDEKILSLNQELISSVNNLSGDVVIKTANKLYPKQSYEILSKYLSLVQKNFHADVESLNYDNAEESANTINRWVSEQTNDKIRNLIDPNSINGLTRLILVNAIYFKGNWDLKFDSNLTTEKDFHLTDGSTKKVQMMKSNKKFRYIYKPAQIDADICELPYTGQNISMTIILPHQGHSLEQVEKQLNDSVLHQIMTLEIPREKINLQVPKFKLEFKTELSNHFKSMGANLPFDESRADFSGITSDPQGLYISEVVHQAVVEVNEEGTEAAAATGVIMMTRMAIMLEPANFICDRPFLFLIHEKKHNSILFFGKYTKPE